MGIGIVAIYVLLVFALSFFVEVFRKSKIYPKQRAILKALLVSMLTTMTPMVIMLVFLLVASNNVLRFFIENLTVTIAIIIFMPIASYFSYRRLVT